MLALVARGLSNAEIATELFITLATVKTHVSRLLTKLAARDRAQLIVIGYESGFVTPAQACSSTVVIWESTLDGLNIPQRRLPRAYDGLSCRRTG